MFMKKGKRLVLTIFILLPILISACGNNIETNMSEQVADVDFDFITQDEELLSLDDLKGDWWIAYFMYTNCQVVCPTTTPHMVSVQNQLHEDGLNPHIVSFSIDPGFDTPAVLRNYAHEYGADLDNWYFLTGYEFDDIQKLSRDSFKTVLESGGPEEHQFVHSTSFFLINPDGEIIKRYDGMSGEEMDVLVSDLKEVM